MQSLLLSDAINDIGDCAVEMVIYLVWSYESLNVCFRICMNGHVLQRLRDRPVARIFRLGGGGGAHLNWEVGPNNER